MGKKENGPASSPETPPINVTPVESAQPPAPPPDAPEPKEGEKREVSFWAHRAGHVPPSAREKLVVDARSRALRGSIHRGPHIDVVVAHAQGHHLPAFAKNAMVTKEQYDACVEAAYSVVCRENWSADEVKTLEDEQAARKAAREKEA